MSCGNKKQIRGGYIEVPSLSNINPFTNTKSTTTNSKNFDKVQSYEQFLEKVKLLYQENPEILKYSLDGVLNKIKINIEDVKLKLDTVNLENPNDNQISSLLNIFMIKELSDYDGIKSYYDKKFQEKKKELEKEKEKCIVECNEKVETLKNEINDKQTKINNIVESNKNNNTKSKLLIEKESLEKDVSTLEEKKTEYEKEFDTKLKLVDTQQDVFHKSVEKLILENKTPKNINPVVTNTTIQLKNTSFSNTNTLPIQGGSRKKSSNIHTFYKDYQQQETKGGGSVKQIFRL
jgi:hypothetical protein